MSCTERGVFVHSLSTCSIADWGPGPGKPGHQGDAGPTCSQSVAGSGPGGQGGLAAGRLPGITAASGFMGAGPLPSGVACPRVEGLGEDTPHGRSPLGGRERPMRCLKESLLFIRGLLKSRRGTRRLNLGWLPFRILRVSGHGGELYAQERRAGSRATD